MDSKLGVVMIFLSLTLTFWLYYIIKSPKFIIKKVNHSFSAIEDKNDPYLNNATKLDLGQPKEYQVYRLDGNGSAEDRASAIVIYYTGGAFIRCSPTLKIFKNYKYDVYTFTYPTIPDHDKEKIMIFGAEMLKKIFRYARERAKNDNIKLILIGYSAGSYFINRLLSLYGLNTILGKNLKAIVDIAPFYGSSTLESGAKNLAIKIFDWLWWSKTQLDNEQFLVNGVPTFRLVAENDVLKESALTVQRQYPAQEFKIYKDFNHMMFASENNTALADVKRYVHKTLERKSD